MTEQMTPDEVLAVIAKHRDSHRSCALADAYSAQEYPRLRDAHTAVAALIAERNALRDIAAIAHDAGLQYLSEAEALVLIRRLTVSAWDSSGSLGQRERRVADSIARAEAASHG